MGANSTKEKDADENIEFNIQIADSCCSFDIDRSPVNAQFNQRVSAAEWGEFADAMEGMNKSHKKMYIILLVFGFIAGIIGVVAMPALFVVVALVGIVGFIYYSCRSSKKMHGLVSDYNKALFRHRGVVVNYHQARGGGEHEPRVPAYFSVGMAYPANEAAAGVLSPDKGGACPSELSERYATANSTFARSAYAQNSISGAVPTQAPVQHFIQQPPQGQSYYPQQQQPSYQQVPQQGQQPPSFQVAPQQQPYYQPVPIQAQVFQVQPPPLPYDNNTTSPDKTL